MADAAVARFARKTKKQAIPKSTVVITTKRLRIPIFMPSAILESLRPKQAAHAKAVDGVSDTEKTSTDNEMINLETLFTGN